MNGMTRFIRKELKSGRAPGEVESDCTAYFGDHLSIEQMREAIREIRKEIGRMFNLCPPAGYRRDLDVKGVGYAE